MKDKIWFYHPDNYKFENLIQDHKCPLPESSKPITTLWGIELRQSKMVPANEIWISDGKRLTGKIILKDKEPGFLTA